MCGFAGIISWSNAHRVHRAVLEKMSARIAHRGPDGSGLYLNHESEITPDNPQVGLVHRRLAIIDLDERANQPFTDGRGRWLVFNGEIYNYRELRQRLDYPWKTQSDTEVLLAAYDQWGEQCVDQLNGMFAFAIWDGAKQELFLARDRMGQKPLYYSILPFSPPARGRRPEMIAFASELPALLTVPSIPTDLNSDALATYLSLGYIPNATIYQSVHKLDPATTLTLRDEGSTTRHYFDCYASFTDPQFTDAQAVSSTATLVKQAVNRQLVADVPVGCFLSGGVDSSVIAASVSKDYDLHTFSIAFDDPRYDESAYAQQVAQHLGTKHRTFHVTPDAAADLPALAAVFGEPFGDSSALPTHYLARETRKHVKVALSGDGGDELFAGYDRYRALKLTQRLSRASLLISAARAVTKALPGTHPKSRSARLKRLLESAHLPSAQRYAAYMRLFPPALIHELIGGPPRDAYDNLVALFDTGLAARPLVPNALAVDRVSYLPDDLLTKVDRASMLHALEVRSPFMDHDLVHFAARLSTDQLLKGGPKRMLREAFAADLPAWVFKRKKMGFAVPIGEWFRASLRPLLQDHLFAANSFARAHFNPTTVQRLADEHQTEKQDHAQRLYALLMLELWWKQQKNE